MKKSNAENKPVVLQVLPELEMGGVEIGTTEIADALCKAGIKNFVASKGGRLVHDLQKMKVKHFTLDLKTKNPLLDLKIYKNWNSNISICKISIFICVIC